MRVVTLAMLVLLTMVPAAAAGQETEWSLEVDDPVGDLSWMGPLNGPDFVDLTSLRVGLEGDDLVFTLLLAGPWASGEG